MRSVFPDELPAHKVFFTEFDVHGDPSVWAASRDREAALQRSLERKLKLLLLTKSNILVAASQLLESPFAHDLLLRHPRLLNTGAIISSIKLDHASSIDFLDVKREEEQARPSSPYHFAVAEDVARMIDEVGTSVRWPLELMSDWFRDRLVGDLADEKSLIRIAMLQEGILFPVELGESISEEQSLSRNRVDELTATYGDSRLRDYVNLYSDFIYYLSGARATESEGVLPQENLIDVSVSDLLGAKTRLSEGEIFFKIFIDTVKAKTSTVFPEGFLDAISIEDAIDLRSVAVSSEFVNQYNQLQLMTKQAITIRDPEKLVLQLEELEEFESGLFQRFNRALDAEMGSRLVEARQRSAGQVLHSLSSIAIPGYGVDSCKDLVVSGLRWAGKRDVADVIDRKVEAGLGACKTTLERMGLIERQVLLDYVDNLKKKYIEKLYA